MKKLLLFLLLCSAFAYAQPALPFPVSTFALCEDSTADGNTIFNLTQKNAEILSLVDPTNYRVQFFTTANDADSGSNPIPNPESFSNIVNPQTIYVRVYNVDNLQDVATTAFDIVVWDRPMATHQSPYQICDNNQDGYEFFDLSSLIMTIGEGQSDVEVTFYETMADAQNDSNELPYFYLNIVPWVQTIFIAVTNTITGCLSVATVDLRLNPVPMVSELSDIIFFESPTDGFYEHFDLTTQNQFILQGQSPQLIDVAYYVTLAEAQSQSGQIVNPADYSNLTNPQTIYAVANNIATGCFGIGEFQLVVTDQLGIAENTFKNKLAISPNPAEDILHVQSDLTIGSIAIYDVQGRMINAQETVEKALELNVSHYVPGIYFLKLKIGNGYQTEKFVKR